MYLRDVLIKFFHSLFFKTEVSAKTSKSMTTKSSKRRPKTSMEGTVNFIEVAENTEICSFALITISGRTVVLWLDLPIRGKERLCESDICVYGSHTRTHVCELVTPGAE